jgi:hypothetical protein
MTVAVSGNAHFRIIKYIENVITGKTSYAVATMIWLTAMEYLCHNDHGYVPLVAKAFRSFPLSWLITGFVTRLTRQVFTSGAGTAYPSGFSWVRVTRSLVLYVSFVDRYLSFVLFLLAIVLSVLLRYTDSHYPLVSSNSSYERFPAKLLFIVGVNCRFQHYLHMYYMSQLTRYSRARFLC